MNARKSWRLCECGHRAFLQRWGWQCNGCGSVQGVADDG
jgi:hypothetical protein